LLCKFVKDSKYLEDLDLSWISVRPALVINLLRILATNKQLKHLNLAEVLLLDENEYYIEVPPQTEDFKDPSHGEETK